ncbi:MAG: MATE family efflux transporter [Gammaproteobacteria bacterium]
MSAVNAFPATTRDWHRRVWRLAGPIILSNSTVPLVGIVDTAVVGHLPDPVYIGAVALGAVVFNFLYWGFGFLRMGTTGFVAQAFGTDDLGEVRTTLARALLLAAVLGCAIVLLQAPIGQGVFWLLRGSTALKALARDYYDVRIWSAPATLANYALLGCLIGIQNTRVALLLQLALNGVNIVFALLFVLALAWGVKGVALAAVLADYGAAILGLWVVSKLLRPAPGQRWVHALLDPVRLKALLHANINILIRTLCLVFGFFYFIAAGGELGDVTLAVNAILMHFQSFAAYGLDGFAHAAEALVGGAYGARNLQAFRTAVRVSSVWAVVVASLYALLYAQFGGAIVAALTGIAEVRAQAAVFMPWMVLLPLISVWSFQLDGIFIGVTRTVEMRNGALLSVSVCIVAIWLLLPAWGNHGLWLAFTLFAAMRGLTLAAWYPRIVRELS